MLIYFKMLLDEAERTPSNKPEANNLPQISKSYSAQVNTL